MAKPKSPSRRELLTNGVKAAGVTCLAGLALTAYVESASKAEAKALLTGAETFATLLKTIRA